LQLDEEVASPVLAGWTISSPSSAVAQGATCLSVPEAATARLNFDALMRQIDRRWRSLDM
jgi:hypothetical protein